MAFDFTTQLYDSPRKNSTYFSGQKKFFLVLIIFYFIIAINIYKLNH